MTLILGADAFIAAEKGDREVSALVKRERLLGRSPITHGGVVAQVWRGGSGPQARLARLLAGTDIRSLGEDLGKRAGNLLRSSGSINAIDAALVGLAVDGDDILTSDVDDLLNLAIHSGAHVELIPI